ncbi:protein rep [Ligilactobacillus ruminis]|uniref:protein rep n=1 Tax=Ligilactobacillus ruminis TaxID=1623 RepID=UPI003F9B4A6F
MRQGKKDFEKQLEENTKLVNYKPGQKLIDKTKNGKERPWRQKKIENLLYNDYMEEINEKKARQIHDCAETLTFQITNEGEQKLYQVWFCKDRLCPMCSWRRSLKSAAELQQILTRAVELKPKDQFLFLTLTVKNVYGKEDLKRTMSELTKGFNRMIKYKKISEKIVGYVRSTEVTVNENDGSYHPHLHVLLMVEPTYFWGREYIPQSEWTKLWKRAMKLDYTPVVNIKKIHDKKGKGDLKSAALEVGKYQTKSKDYLSDDTNWDENLKRISDLRYGLQNTRQYGYGGLLKQIALELKKGDEDDLVHVDLDDDQSETKKKVKICMAVWSYEHYNYFWKKKE